MQKQQTLKKTIGIKGIGLHSGCVSMLEIEPAPENYGIRFLRTDIANAEEIPALYNKVIDTRN